MQSKRALFYKVKMRGGYEPAIHIALVDKPSELPLGEHSVVKIESGVLPDVRFTQTNGIYYPVELLVSVVVLSGTQGMRHPLNTVHNGARKIVCGIHSGWRK